jgi:hypothetical protein
VQVLHQIDEVIRTGAHLLPELRGRLVRELERQFQPDEQVFAAMRLNVWQEREAEGTTLSGMEDIVRTGGEIGEVLGRVAAVESSGGSVDHRALTEGDVQSRRRGLFGEWLILVNDPKRWISRPLEARALMAFFLLDYSLYLTIDLREIDRILLDTSGDNRVPVVSDAARVQDESVPGRVGLTALRLLTQLLRVEPSGSELLVEPSWIYQTSDPLLLLKLLPAGHRSERLGPLADAFEHQLRFHMASDEEFSPEHFLYFITVRKPHPDFYDQLIRTCQYRVYRTEGGRVVPVKEILQTFAREARAVDEKDEVSELVSEYSTITGNDTLPGESIFSEELVRLRQSLIALADADDPFEGLARLTDLLNPKTKDSLSGSKGLTDFIGRVNTQNYHVVQDGLAEWVGQSFDQFAAAMQEYAVCLDDEIPALIPKTLSEIGGARDAALSIRRHLSDVTEAGRRFSGSVEAKLLEYAVSSVRARVTEWVTSLERLHDTWMARHERSAEKTWRELAEKICALRNRDMRHRILELFYRSLLNAGTEGAGGTLEGVRSFRVERDEWVREYAVLHWSTGLLHYEGFLAPEDRRLWLELTVDTWNRLVEEAMAEGYESRVLRLVTDSLYVPLLKDEASTPVLHAAESWLFDRYHFSPVRSIGRTIGEVNRSVASLRTAGAFLVHFSHVWLALLVGAMLLLDFGDAWTAMAAEGDISGIILTSLLGIGGTFLYLLTDLVKRTRQAPEDNFWRHRLSKLVRAGLFLMLCLVVAFGLTALLWLLLSGTEVVVHGENAVYHVVVWTAFALFVGVFFGLLADAA